MLVRLPDMFIAHLPLRQVSKAGEIVGIALADHIIIGDNRYYSMKEYGHMD